MNKWLSRKFWESFLEEVVGLVVFVFGASAGNMTAVVGGGIIAVLALFGYLKTEGDIDKAKQS